MSGYAMHPGGLWIDERLAEPTLSGAVEELGIPASDRWKAPTTQKERHTQYAKMRDYDSGVGGFLSAIHTLLAQPRWKIVKNDGPNADRAYEIITRSFSGLLTPFGLVLEDLLSCIVYGWSAPEAIFEIKDGTVLLTDIDSRSQDDWTSWVYDSDGRAVGWAQAAPGNRVRHIPFWKSVYVEARSAPGRAPGGLSWLQPSARSSYFREKLEEAEATRAEHDAVGLPRYQVPPAILATNANAAMREERRKKQEFVQKIRRGRYEGILVPSKVDPTKGTPSGYELDLMASPGAAVALDNPIRRHQTGVLVPLLAQFLTLGAQNSGSHSLADSFTSLFALSGGVFLARNRMAIQRKIDLTCKLNGIQDPGSIPRLSHSDIETRDVSKFADAMTKLMPLGLIVKTAEVVAASHEAFGFEAPNQQSIQAVIG